MGVWLKTRSGAPIDLRDGSTFENPTRVVSDQPVWFENLEPEDVEHDAEFVVCMPPMPQEKPPATKAKVKRKLDI